MIWVKRRSSNASPASSKSGSTMQEISGSGSISATNGPSLGRASHRLTPIQRYSVKVAGVSISPEDRLTVPSHPRVDFRVAQGSRRSENDVRRCQLAFDIDHGDPLA
jgi:hypothetical protein